MSKATWISKDKYFTVFHLINANVETGEIANLAGVSCRTVKRARQYLNRAYCGTLTEDPADKENNNLRVWALEFCKSHPKKNTPAPPQPPKDKMRFDFDEQGLFLTRFLTELFFLASMGCSTLPFPVPAHYFTDHQSVLLAWRLGGIKTSIYAADLEEPYLKWRKHTLGDYDITEQLEEFESD